jgi:hypothetical protein
MDNQYTVDMFVNGDMLDNIHQVEDEMVIASNGGSNVTSKMGILPGYGPVWYDPDGIENIVSLLRVKQKYHVTFNSDNNSFVVTKADGTVFEFVESSCRLYYYNLAAGSNKCSGVTMVNMVAGKKSKYTNEDYLHAVSARQIQIRISHPSTKDLKQIIAKNQLLSCAVTRADVMAAEDIFGPDLGSLKGKTTRDRPHQVRDIVTPLPASIMERYRSVTLCANIMHVNGIPFLIAISCNLQFGTIEAQPNCQEKTLVSSLVSMIKVYK